ncbi:MAG: hypothetical protein KAT06_05215 [Gammaproteobacteria bacterium]|nr:hypothetical protein [Gammaproteobacteria bacterium]
MTLPVLNLPLLSSKRPKPYIKPKKFRLWLNGLPVGNVQKSSQIVLQQLKILNQSRYPYSERSQLLDALRPTIRQLLLSLKQPLHRANLPLSDENNLVAQLIQDLLSEIAHGYKLITSDLMEKNSRKENDQLLLRESIYLSIQYLARSIVESYLIYTAPQYDIWRELHQLYRYAEYEHIQNEAIDDPYPDYVLPVQYTIDLVYKRIVLLSLSAPYHLMQNEAEDIYYLVSAWTSVCEIQELEKKHISNQYGVDFATDMSPRYIPDNLEWEPVDGRVIDISEVKARLTNHTTKILRLNVDSDDLINDDTPRSLKERQQRDMLLRLMDAWHSKLTRGTHREDRGAKLRMALGLNACHFYCSNKATFTPEMDELRLISSTENKQATVFANIYREALHKDRIHENNAYPISPWQQHNISHTGLALSCGESCNNMNIKVGEVVSYLFESKTGLRWKIGIIRWVHINEENNIDMGIMNLSHSAVPIAIKAVKGLGKGTDYFRSLLVPKQVSIRQLRSIIVPSMLYDIGTALSVNMKTKLFYIKLRKLIISTGNIAMFEFETLENAPVDLSQEI